MAVVKIKGMSCQHCVGSVKDALEKLDGVENVVVDLDKGEASFDGAVNDKLVQDTIVGIGFEVVE